MLTSRQQCVKQAMPGRQVKRKVLERVRRSPLGWVILFTPQAVALVIILVPIFTKSNRLLYPQEYDKLSLKKLGLRGGLMGRCWPGWLGLSLGLALVLVGFRRGEFHPLWIKGIRFCLECMGLGR
ncbi:CD1871A family CXXC motif-containing protein [Desulfothermobacter acidiphilus]|uniref:CD1871A family CXXC motif-containing protein n=1 Tax=Desulfothermobacter acidiphilus TaxID=1938353 RepID=UPI003F893BE5